MAFQPVGRAKRLDIATRRLVRVLDTLTVANMRTLEMKISDSGPSHLRVDPHILTEARKALIDSKSLVRDGVWYHRRMTDRDLVRNRMKVLNALHQRTVRRDFVLRLGQCLEIAIQRGLEASGIEFVGSFLNLDSHDDSTLYKKEEPPLRFSGSRMPGEKRFDFLVFHPAAGRIGIEAKIFANGFTHSA